MKVCSRKTVFSALRFAVTCFGICVGVLFAASPVSCKLTEEGIQIVSVDKTAPQIVSFAFKQRSVLEMGCTEPVTLKDVVFREADSLADATQAVSISYDDTKTVAELTLSAPTEIGVRYELCGIVEDMNGNTLTFSLPFTGYNDNLPCMILTEIRSAGTKASPEYIELYVLKGGNTAGVEIWSAYDGKDKAYAFPPIDVQTGEYIVVHYRTDPDTPDLCIDERGDDLALATFVSKKNDTCDTARDLWAENEDDSARINDNDVILLVCDNGSTIMDAVLYAKSTLKKWSTTQAEYAKLAAAKGLWNSAELAEAACNDGAYLSRPLCRQNVEALKAKTIADDAIIRSTADDWFVVANSAQKPGSTPGLPNSDEPYAP